jgi:DNA-directed RNA polymerase subunit RPC12/RpoP
MSYQSPFDEFVYVCNDCGRIFDLLDEHDLIDYRYNHENCEPNWLYEDRQAEMKWEQENR